jgi:hypothetical protein
MLESHSELRTGSPRDASPQGEPSPTTQVVRDGGMVRVETKRGCGRAARNGLLPVRTRGRKIAQVSARNTRRLSAVARSRSIGAKHPQLRFAENFALDQGKDAVDIARAEGNHDVTRLGGFSE